MSEEEIGPKIVSPRERDLIVAYLSYALDDVEVISPSGFHHLRMAISSIARDNALGAGAAELLGMLEYDRKSAN